MQRALLIAALMTPGPLFAEEPTPAETAVAREQFKRGFAAAKENRWNDAYDAFSRSYALTKMTSILFNLAGAEVKTGRWVEARETYRKFLKAEDAQKSAKAEAQRLLARLEAQMPRAVITVEAPAVGDTVTLDGSELTAPLLGIELPLNPGHHVLVRARNGVEIARTELEIALGERREVQLTAPPVEPPPSLSPKTVQTPSHPPIAEVSGERPAGEDERSFFAGPWFWIIAGVVVLGGGVTAGVLLANRDSDPYAGTTGIVVRGLVP